MKTPPALPLQLKVVRSKRPCLCKSCENPTVGTLVLCDGWNFLTEPLCWRCYNLFLYAVANLPEEKQ